MCFFSHIVLKDHINIGIIINSHGLMNEFIYGQSLTTNRFVAMLLQTTT
jgi:hypothetical protein